MSKINDIYFQLISNNVDLEKEHKKMLGTTIFKIQEEPNTHK